MSSGYLRSVQAADIVRSLLVRQPEDRASIKDVLEAAAKLDL